MDEQLRFLDRLSAAAVDAAIRFGPKLIVAGLIMVAGYYAGRWVGRALARALRAFHLEPPVLSLLRRIAHLAVLGLFAIMALQNLGVELLPLLAGLGIAGAGIALADAGRAWQPRRGPLDHLLAAVPRRRLHLDRQGRGRGARHRPVQYDAWVMPTCRAS
jgi:hypothetical protein